MDSARSHAVDLDQHVARAVDDVDPVERVARVRDVALVLLVPGVERLELEQHVAVQRRVGRAERRRLRAAGARGQRLPGRGVDGERDARVEHGPVAELRRAHGGDAGGLVDPVLGGDQLGGDVGRRDGVGGDDALRLPDEQRARAVDDGDPAQGAADPLLGRLMAQGAELAHHQVAQSGAHGASVPRRRARVTRPGTRTCRAAPPAAPRNAPRTSRAPSGARRRGRRPAPRR